VSGGDLGKLIARAEEVLARGKRCSRRRRRIRLEKNDRGALAQRAARIFARCAASNAIALSDLVAIDEQKKSIDQNTPIVAGLPANNVL
jgi:predicted AAA+ superfamily ATPase